jgi:hypothetical protein
LCNGFTREGRRSRCDDIEQVADPSTANRGGFRRRCGTPGGLLREQVIQVVGQYLEAVRHNDTSALPLHPDAVCDFPTNTYRGAASFRKGLDDFARVMKNIDVVRLVVDGEHCVALVNIDTVFGVIRHESCRHA